MPSAQRALVASWHRGSVPSSLRTTQPVLELPDFLDLVEDSDLPELVPDAGTDEDENSGEEGAGHDEPEAEGTPRLERVLDQWSCPLNDRMRRTHELVQPIHSLPAAGH